MFRACIVGILVIFFSCLESHARIWLVPEERESVEQACNIAADNDTILISPGTYRENLSLDKNLVIGSLYLTSNDTAYLDSTILEGNGDGCVVEIFGRTSPTFSGLTITNGRQDSGGGFRIRNNSNPSILSCRIFGNSGGVYCTEGSDAIIADCRIFDNHSEFGGEGIRFRDCPEPQIIRTYISNNSGAGIFCQGNSDAQIVDCIIEQNQKKGISLSNSSPTIQNCIINGNVGEIVGGVGFLQESNAIVTNCTITGNSGEATGGIACYNSDPQISETTISGNFGGSVGGVKCAFNAAPIFNNCIINDNLSTGLWGAILCFECSPRFNYCTISGNSSSEGCAGISLRRSSAEFFRCLIVDHNSIGNGGAIYSSESSPTFTHCTIAKNISIANGGAFYIEGGGTPVVVNSILWANTPPSIYLQSWGEVEEDRAGLVMSYCDLELADEGIVTRGRVELDFGKGCIDANPCFDPSEERNYHLRLDSPCIDACSELYQRDPDRTIADMGAFYLPQPNLYLSRHEFSFNGIHIGERDSVDIIIRNVGLGSLNIDSLSIRSNDNAFEIATNSRPFTLEPDERYTVRISFAPSNSGENRGVLFIDSNDRDRPREFVHLRGNVLEVDEPGYLTPAAFEITDIYPNPFNNEAVINFTLPVYSQVNFKVMDITGRAIMSINSDFYPAGNNTISTGMKSLETGTYFLQAENNNILWTRKVIKIQ
ncbi:MAG: T9SS type A sorting domain-containing protein [Calditrichaeota bacterium]|jgi:parallel beta-helix repeat protein|nr:T9SS type A sorting domain-containing protein [Calditrichota bacterium]MBT7619322.1 T9SS type A sorting domain-containing protein [Calditrichota bacterium]MBT7788459.1 T9SS type A sorting domain-containing protein [Calditrichota bacterium]